MAITSIKKTNIFNDKQISNFAGYFDMLTRIRSRLLQEGCIIKEGQVIRLNPKAKVTPKI